MRELRTIAEASIPRALEKAERYRFLNEPAEAESICLDVLAADPDNEAALIMLVLALSDQLDERPAAVFGRAKDVAAKIRDDYARAYFHALLCERRAKAHQKQKSPGSGGVAYEWYQQALEGYARALELRQPGNEDAVLRWNTCVRALASDPSLKPAPIDSFTPLLE
ncbi:MAG: hypothetical protein ACREI7_09230 [Myxococcota bacterium]